MRRLLLLCAVAAVAGLVAAGTAGATRECNGFQVCVPVAGPWVLAPGRAETQWQLSCPRNFIVGGLDAELTSRALDVVFRANLGSPVNPGISTSTAAVFLGRLAVGRDPAATFRPHIGCIPASGGGARVPTAHHKVYPPGRPTVVRAKTIAVRAGATRHVTRSCRGGERLVTATSAIGFYGKQPPSRSVARAVQVAARKTHGRFTATIHGEAGVRGARAVVQLDLVCAGGG
ncbi:MAG TPA: hypothetical protein VE220_08025 [Gaiellaceae bacterium]|nr:hypothetical protein [Gaiellaceae bacterium]